MVEAGDKKKEKFADYIHTLIHSLRLIPNYKPTNFEFQISKMTSDTFATECDECKAKAEYYKYHPVENNSGGFLKGLFGG